MAECHRGHPRVADRQRRCLECRRGYDRSRAGQGERLASRRRYARSANGFLTRGIYNAQQRITRKAELVRQLMQELAHG